MFLNLCIRMLMGDICGCMVYVTCNILSMFYLQNAAIGIYPDDVWLIWLCCFAFIAVNYRDCTSHSGSNHDHPVVTFSGHILHWWLVSLVWCPTLQLPVITMADGRVTMADGPPAKKPKTASPATAPGLDSSGTFLFAKANMRSI